MSQDPYGAPPAPQPGQPQPTPPQWGVPQQQWVPVYAGAPARPTNGLAIAAMVLGIIWLYWLGSILAVIFGHIALNQIKRNPNQNGRGMAIAGVALGWTGVGIGLLVMIVAIAAASSSSGY